MPIQLRGRFIARCLPVTLFVAAAAAFGATSLAGCGQSRPGEQTECLSNRKFFETKIWGAFMSTNCIQCHVLDGDAVAQGARFVLQPPSYPGFVDANLKTLQAISQIQYNGTSELLLKPIGQAGHGGGVRIDPNGPEIGALTELVNRFQQGEPCGDVPSKALADVQLSDNKTTLRKASLDLGGRLPSADDLSKVADNQDASLDAALDQLMKEDTFYTRLHEIWNDLFLTDEFLEYGGRAIDALQTSDYPGLTNYKDGNQPESMAPERPYINRAIASEPLDLISYVVRNNRPFTEIVTANYSLVDAYSGYAYGALDASGNPLFPNEPQLGNDDYQTLDRFKEGHVTLGTGVAIPHAGLLTTPMFLNRWQTTPTNRDRGRARRVYLYLLATDILKIATRPVDASKVTAVDNPTLNSPACTVCHKLVDPVAGGFRGWDDFNYAEFDGKGEWHTDMFESGFGDDMMPPSQYASGLQWLGSEIAKDPRFAINAVYVMYKGLTGQSPLTYPSDTTSATFASDIEAWDAQDAFFRATTTDFQNNNYDLKRVVKAIVKSAYYRGVTVSTSGDAESDALHTQVGGARFLTPEMLNRKIVAVTGGIHWRKNYDWMNQHDWLLDGDDSYNITYGGIDSDTVPTRLTDPNGVSAAVIHRMSNELACTLAPWDFSQSADQRRFFGNVDVTEVPESSGHAVDQSVTDIKNQIVSLHSLILGEDLDVNDPEIERTYQVFLGTWHELSANPKDTGLGQCGLNNSPIDGSDLSDDQKLNDDKNFTIRSWQAVLTYLFQDYKFVYE